jgi:hypothetical protein
MSPVIDDLLVTNIRNLRKEIVGKRDRTSRSLSALSNQDGSYASDHRAMIRLYGDLLDVIDRHEKKAASAA